MVTVTKELSGQNGRFLTKELAKSAMSLGHSRG